VGEGGCEIYPYARTVLAENSCAIIWALAEADFQYTLLRCLWKEAPNSLWIHLRRDLKCEVFTSLASLNKVR
jgi:hypothetical protein